MDETSRAKWMADRGREIYDPWTQEIVEACTTPEFMGEHTAALEENYPGITSGVPLSPDHVLLPLFSVGQDIVMKVDKQHGISERILLPHKDEILKYTSARQLMSPSVEVGRAETEEEAVRVHAKDSLKFAMFFSAGVVNDVFLEQTAKAGNANDIANMMLVKEQAATPGDEFHATLVDGCGRLWFEMADTFTPGQSIEDLSTAYGMRKLAFLGRSLGNKSLRQSVNLLSCTGFDTISNKAANIETNQKTHWPAWAERAHRFGRTVGEKPEAVLGYDTTTETFSVPGDIMGFLVDKLKEQRKNGLSEESKRTAGESLQQLDEANKTAAGESTKAFSSGCPVRNTASMNRVTGFTGNLYDNLVDYYAVNGFAERL
jgi:hypothetical protein